MIHSITLQNFHSIKDPVTLSFLVDRYAPKSNAYVDTSDGKRISKVEVIVGPNASGKTTVLTGLTIIQWLLSMSFLNARYEIDDLMAPHANDSKKPTVLSTTFQIDEDVFDYTVSSLKGRIIFESLNYTTLNNVRKSKKNIFSREWNKTKKAYDFEYRKSGLKIPFEDLDTTIVEEASMNAISATFGEEMTYKVGKYWLNMVTNIELSKQKLDIYGYQAKSILSKMSKDSDESQQFFDEIRGYDKTIQGFNYKSKKIEFASKDGGTYELDINHVSSGTTQLLVVKDKLDQALKNGSVAIIDEFDAYLHPVWLHELVSQFFDPKINTKNAQLITSTHNAQVLNLLDKWQINVADNKNGFTELTRLDEIDGVRNDDNFSAGYLGDKYGGIPSIY